MNKRITLVLSLLAAFTASMFTGFVIFLVTAFLHKSGSGSMIGNNENEVYDYQYLEYNPETNYASLGMVSIMKEIDDYQSFENDEHNYILISQFGAKEYKCTGNCYCTDKRRSAASALPLTKGLIYLLTAVSSSYAFLVAKEHFEKSCKEESGGVCSSVDHEITSEVFACKLVGDSSVDNEVKKEKKFFCEGHCLTKKYRTRRAKLMARDYDCEEMKMDGEVIVNPMELKVIGEDWDQEISIVQTARLLFQENLLYDYCFLGSQEDDITNFMENGKKFYVKKSTNMCVAKNKIGLNPSIKCRLIDADFECSLED